MVDFPDLDGDDVDELTDEDKEKIDQYLADLREERPSATSSRPDPPDTCPSCGSQTSIDHRSDEHSSWEPRRGNPGRTRVTDVEKYVLTCPECGDLWTLDTEERGSKVY